MVSKSVQKNRGQTPAPAQVDEVAECEPISPSSRKKNFSHFASKVAIWCGRPWASAAAVSLILMWAVTGPFFNFSDHWQIVVSTGTAIVTFLMVFVIQSSQNRESMAVHLKLDEIIRTLEGARNIMVAAEEFDEDRLKELHTHFKGLAQDAERVVDTRPGSKT